MYEELNGAVTVGIQKTKMLNKKVNSKVQAQELLELNKESSRNLDGDYSHYIMAKMLVVICSCLKI